jgi:hypothetical protein
MPAHLMTTLPAFLAYFAVAMVLLALFLLVYLNVTPYHEMALIRAGNSAAAVSLSGALLGFAMPSSQRHRPQRYADRPGILGSNRRHHPDSGLSGRQIHLSTAQSGRSRRQAGTGDLSGGHFARCRRDQRGLHGLLTDPTGNRIRAPDHQRLL